MSTITPRRRIAAATGAFALAALVSLGLTGPASAAPIGDVGNIDDPDAGTGQIIVHKYVKEAGNGTVRNDGTEVDTTGWTAIEDVEFTVTEVFFEGTALELLENSGWEAAEDIAAGFDPNNAVASLTGQTDVTLDTGNAAVLDTDANGLATFGGLTYGLYLVQETDSPASVTDPAQPFLVTIPFPTGPTHPTNPNEWLYSVHVYPKNAATGVDKIVLDTDTAFYTEADYVTWEVTVDVPQLPSGATTFDTFQLVDTIDPDELEFVTSVPTGITPRGITVYNALGNDVTSNFALTTDYSFAISGVDDEIQTLNFTAAGRLDLFTHAQGGTVVWTVPTEVVALPDPYAALVNEVTSYVNDSELDSDASQDFGQLRVLKYAETESDPEVPLAGATFHLYHDANDDGIADPAERVTAGGVDEWVSNASGELDIDALKPGDYLIVEIEAPAGYQTLGIDNPVEVTVVPGEVVAGSLNYSAVENLQLPPFALPFTGSNGVITFSLLGGGLMALAIGLAIVARRRKAQHV